MSCQYSDMSCQYVFRYNLQKRKSSIAVLLHFAIIS